MSARPAAEIRIGDHVHTGTGYTAGDGATRTGIVRQIQRHTHWHGVPGDWFAFVYDTHDPGPYEAPSGYFAAAADAPVTLAQEKP